MEQSRIALARQLAVQSTTVLTQFPEQLSLPVLLALESTRLHTSFETTQALRTALARLPLVVRSQSGEPGLPDRVNALAFSPDGRYVVAARDEGNAILVDLVQGKASAVLPHLEEPGSIIYLPGGRVGWDVVGEDREVTSVAISPDSRFVVTGSRDRTARLWDIASGHESRRWPHGAAVNSVAFHPAGTALATGSKDGAVIVFEIATGQKTYEHKENRGVRYTTTLTFGPGEKPIKEVVASPSTAEVREIASSPDGRHLAVLYKDSSVALLNAKTGARRHTWHAGFEGRGLAFSSDSKKLATATGDAASVWDVETAKQLFKASHGGLEVSPPALIVDVAFSPDGNYLATAGTDSTARIWDLVNGQERVRMREAGAVFTVAFGHDGATLSTGSTSGARLWEVGSGRERWRVVGDNMFVTFSPDGRLVASGGPNDGTVSVVDVSRADQPARMVHSNSIGAVSVSVDGSRVATADDEGAVRLWSSAGQLMAVGESPIYGPGDLVFSHDGRFVAGAGRNPPLAIMSAGEGLAATALATVDDEVNLFNTINHPVPMSSHYIVASERRPGHLRILETSGGRELLRIEANKVDDVKLDPTGTVLAFRQYDERSETPVIRVWDLAHGFERGRRSMAGGSFAPSPNGQFLAVDAVEKGNGPSPDYHADVWDLSTGSRVARIPRDRDEAIVAFDPSGKRLLTSGSSGSEIRVWDLPTGTLALRLAHQAQVETIKFSVEQSVIATLSGGIVYVWSASTGDLMTQVADAAGVTDFDVSRDWHLLTGTSDGVVTLWLWRTEDLRAEACKRLTRNLTESEWQQYLGVAPYQPSCPNLPVAKSTQIGQQP